MEEKHAEPVDYLFVSIDTLLTTVTLTSGQFVYILLSQYQTAIERKGLNYTVCLRNVDSLSRNE